MALEIDIRIFATFGHDNWGVLKETILLQVIQQRHLYVEVFIRSYLLAVVSGSAVVVVVVDVVGSVVATETTVLRFTYITAYILCFDFSRLHSL